MCIRDRCISVRSYCIVDGVCVCQNVVLALSPLRHLYQLRGTSRFSTLSVFSAAESSSIAAGFSLQRTASPHARTLRDLNLMGYTFWSVIGYVPRRLPLQTLMPRLHQRNKLRVARNTQLAARNMMLVARNKLRVAKLRATSCTIRLIVQNQLL